MKHLTLIIGALVLLAWCAPSRACSVDPYPAEFEIDDTLGATDLNPPSPPIVDEIEIVRSDYPPPGEGDCGELGSLVFLVELSDEESAEDQIGIEIEVVKGDTPSGLELPEYPMPVSDGWVGFIWQDYPEEVLSFTVALVAVDKAGNRSSPVEAEVTHSGSPSKGRPGIQCNAVAPGAESDKSRPGWLTLLALWYSSAFL